MTKNYIAKNKHGISDRKHKFLRMVFIISFMIIPLLHFLIFYVFVNFNSFIMAFQTPNNGQYEFVGIANFKKVWDLIIKGSTYPVWNLKLSFINTFKTFAIQIIMFPIGLFVSYFIYKKVPGYKTFRVIFYLPVIISPVVVSFFFTELMRYDSFFVSFIKKLHNIDYMLSPLASTDFANKMIFLNLIWTGFPGNIIVWGGTFSRIPDSVIESARIDGVSWIREMFQIILPLVWPTFVLMITTQIAMVFGATGNVFLLTHGEYGTQTVSNWIYMQVQASTNPMASDGLNLVSALGLGLTVISCGIAIFVRKFLNKNVEEITY